MRLRVRLSKKVPTLPYVPVMTKLISDAAADLKGLASAGQQIFGATCDVSVEDDVEKFFDEVRRRLGPVNVLVNNAGVYGPKGESEIRGLSGMGSSD